MQKTLSSVLNAISMITVPSGAVMATNGTTVEGIILMVLGAGIQYLKYYIQENKLVK